MVNVGVRMSLGQFQVPLAVDAGVSNADFGLILGWHNLAIGVGALWAAARAERWGAASTIAVGAAMLAFALCLAAWAGDVFFAGVPVVLAVAIGLVAGFAGAACGLPIVLGLVARAAPAEKRFRFMAFVASGGAFGQFVTPPYAQLAIDSLGSSGGLAALAVFAALTVPLTRFLKTQVERPPTSSACDGRHVATLGAALRDVVFRRLSFGFFVCGFTIALVASHLDAYRVACGMPQGSGAVGLAVIGFVNIVGTLAAGVAGDRCSPHNALGLIYLGRAIAISAFILAPKTELTVIAFAAAMGALWFSSIPLTCGAMADRHGAEAVPRLFGAAILSHQLGAFGGAVLGGFAFPTVANIEVVWWLAVGLSLCAAVINRMNFNNKTALKTYSEKIFCEKRKIETQ
ncbi:MAG: MFS transporter [Pseudomonadota bacterium]